MAIFKHIHKENGSRTVPDAPSQQDVRRLTEYILRPSAHGKIVRNDFANETAAGIADEVMALADERLKYKAFHFMFSFPKDEEARWQANLDALLLDFKERFGIFKMVAADHRDKDNYHVHIAVFAQTKRGHKLRLETHQDGHAIGVAQSLRRIAEEWEDRIGGRKTGRGAVRNLSLSKESLEAAQRQYREGEAPTPIPRKLQLKADIERAVALATGFDSLDQQAAALGIAVRIKRDEQGNALGVSFARDGVSIRGRDAGFTLRALQKLYGTHTTPPGRSLAPCLAGPDRPSTHRPAETGLRPAEPASAGAEPAHPRARGAAGRQRGADRGVLRETEKLLRLLTRGTTTPPSLLAWVSVVLAGLADEYPSQSPFPPKVDL